MRIYHYGTDTATHYDLPTNYNSSTDGVWWDHLSSYPPPVISEAEQRRRAGENPRSRIGLIIWG